MSMNYLRVGAAANYRIRAQGVLDTSWADYLPGMLIETEQTPDGPVVVLTGYAVDQALLLGVLNQLNRLGLPLLTVERLAAHQSDES